jgi:hypothetical protein
MAIPVISTPTLTVISAELLTSLASFRLLLGLIERRPGEGCPYDSSGCTDVAATGIPPEAVSRGHL